MRSESNASFYPGYCSVLIAGQVVADPAAYALLRLSRSARLIARQLTFSAGYHASQDQFESCSLPTRYEVANIDPAFPTPRRPIAHLGYRVLNPVRLGEPPTARVEKTPPRWSEGGRGR